MWTCSQTRYLTRLPFNGHLFLRNWIHNLELNLTRPAHAQAPVHENDPVAAAFHDTTLKMKMQIVNAYLGLDRSLTSVLDSYSSLVITAKTRGHINHSTGLCLFSPSTVHGWPVTDTRQAADRVASWYCQRRESFSANGLVSGGKQTMAVMFGAISDDF